MAYLADHQAPMFGSRDIAGWLGTMQELSWRWRPPTTAATRAEEKDTVRGLSRWLAGWVLAPYSRPGITLDVSEDMSTTSLPIDVAFTREVLLDFRQKLIQSEHKDDVCTSFNHFVQESLIVGSIDERSVRETLDFVTEAINASFQNPSEASSRRLDFYQTIWEGLSTCRVSYLHELQPSTMSLMLSLVAEIPHGNSSKALVARIMSASSLTQLDGMTESIVKVIKSWSTTKSKMTLARDYEHQLEELTRIVDSAYESAKALIALLDDALPKSKAEYDQRLRFFSSDRVRGLRQKIQEDLNAALVNLRRHEDVVFPIRQTTNDLVDCFKGLSAASVTSVMRRCLDLLVNTSSSKVDRETNCLITLSFIAAQLPNVDHVSFMNLWKSVERSGFYIPDRMGSELLLLHMIKERSVRKNLDLLRNHFEIGLQDSGSKGYGLLLDVLLQYEPSPKGYAFMLRTLKELGRHTCIVDALCYVRESSPKLNLPFLRARIADLAEINSQLALRLYKAYFPSKWSAAQFNHPRNPALLFSMIDNPRTEPADIWRTFGKQVRDEQGETPDLASDQVQLVARMADRFATSTVRPQRVAFREVSKCLHFVNRHRAPLPWEMSRAIVYAGATREVLRDNWIGKERLKWILYVVEKAEGLKVAQEVEEVVNQWMEHLILKNGNRRVLKTQLDEARRGVAAGRKVSE